MGGKTFEVDWFCGDCVLYRDSWVRPLRTEGDFEATTVCPKCGQGYIELKVAGRWVEHGRKV